jgi:Tfp pilus assembly protein FimV
MVQANKRIVRLVFMVIVLSFIFTSGAILHAYAGGNAEDSSASSTPSVSAQADTSAASASKPSPAVIRTVDVCPGDTLWDIASLNMPKGGNIRSYINKIKKVNGLKNSDIRAGQILVLP